MVQLIAVKAAPNDIPLIRNVKMKKRFVLSIGLCLVMILSGITACSSADKASDTQQEAAAEA